MENPIALKLRETIAPLTYGVRVDPDLVRKLREGSSKGGPSILVTRKFTVLDDLGVGVIDPADVVSIVEGDWEDAIILVAPPGKRQPDHEQPGDSGFLEEVAKAAPNLIELAQKVIAEIRGAGVDGSLKKEGPRWVNRPINTFTLKIQPRAGNFNFTLYGNPESYSAGEFLRRDQNSYSRGWVRTGDDAQRLASLAQLSHSRRKR